MVEVVEEEEEPSVDVTEPARRGRATEELASAIFLDMAFK